MGKISISRLWERGHPAFLSIIALAGACYAGLTFEDARMSNQLSSAINISAILMGFTGTANAMLLSFNSKQFQAIRNNSALWSMLLTYFRSALWSSIVLCFYSLLLFSVDLKKIPVFSISKIANVIETLLMPLWVAGLVFALLSFFRVLRAVFALLRTM